MDLIEAVIGLAPNLFYGTGLAACILVFRRAQSEQLGRRRFSSSTPSREFEDRAAPRTISPEHVERIYGWYRHVLGCSRAWPGGNADEIAANDHNLNIPRYVGTVNETTARWFRVRRRNETVREVQARAWAAEDRLTALLMRERTAEVTPDSTRISQQQLESYSGARPCSCAARSTPATTSSSSFRCSSTSASATCSTRKCRPR